MSLSRRSTSLTAVLCIALGTAAVAAVLHLVSVALLRPAPFPDAQRLQRVWLAADQGQRRIDLSLPEARELAAGLRGVEAVALAARSRVVGRLPGGGERLRGEAVSANYFALLGLKPALGRGFTDGDFAADAPPVALISDALWRRAFAADPGVVGRVLQTEDAALTILGVLPPGFAGTVENDEVELWLPLPQYLPAALRDNREARQTWTLVRLPTGQDADGLAAELERWRADWATRFPQQYRALRLVHEPFGENWRAPLRDNAMLLLAAVVVLLAIAGLNVSGLLLARALDRRRELALKQALGASRRRIAAQLFLETALLVGAGGLLGLLAAVPLLHAFLSLSPAALPSYLALGFDPLAGALALAAIGGTALLAGVLPALLGSRVAPAAALAEQSRSASAGPRERRLGRRLIAAELALSLVLLVVASLLLRSYHGMSRTELGYRSEHVLRLALTLDRSEAAAFGDLHGFQQRLLDTLRAQPGVQAAGLVWPTLPPWDGQRAELLDFADGERRIDVGLHAIDPGLLPTLGIGLVAGRGIEPGDWQRQARVAVVSAALAERLGGDVLGRELQLAESAELPAALQGRFRIVGIAANVRWDGLGEQGSGRLLRPDDARVDAFDLYLPLPPLGRNLSIAVHTGPEPLTLVEPLRRAIAGLAPASALHWISSMRDELASEYASARFYTALLLAFGGSAVLLAAVGLFAQLSQAVLRRRSELGVRLALGASPRRLAFEIVGDGLRTALAGLAAGLLLAWLAARVLTGFLYGIGPADPGAYLLAALALLLVVLLTCALPARHAARLEPLVALRGE